MHSSRVRDQNQQPQVPEFYYDTMINEQNKSAEAVHEIIEQLILNGAQILHMKYIKSQIRPYASRTLARELVMNASWALAPIGPADVVAEPDEDLEIPPIDEWAGGVLPVRNSDASGLRTSVTPQREVRRPTTTTHRTRQTESQQTETRDTPQPSTSIATYRSKGPAQNREPAKKKPKQELSEAQIIMKTFEEARKKTNVAMKAVTVDSDFSVIQINPPHGLPPALIVPKVATKKATKTEKTSTSIARPPRAVIKKPEKPKRRALPKLIEADVPQFDEEVAEISFSDKFVCAPGVTFKDGTTVKSRPQQSNAAQLTRAQYEQYLEEMKHMADEDHHAS